MHLSDAELFFRETRSLIRSRPLRRKRSYVRPDRNPSLSTRNLQPEQLPDLEQEALFGSADWRDIVVISRVGQLTFQK
jgi:hypothetical protein